MNEIEMLLAQMAAAGTNEKGEIKMNENEMEEIKAALDRIDHRTIINEEMKKIYDAIEVITNGLRSGPGIPGPIFSWPEEEIIRVCAYIVAWNIFAQQYLAEIKKESD